MKLTPEQHAQFDKEGYLFFPGIFSPEETRVMVDDVPQLRICTASRSPNWHAIPQKAA